MVGVAPDLRPREHRPGWVVTHYIISPCSLSRAGHGLSEAVQQQGYLLSLGLPLSMVQVTRVLGVSLAS